MSNTFFTIFFVTILITRIFLYFKPTASPTVKGFRFHHYMYGIAAMIFALPLRSVIIFAIGLGLFIDELTYLLIGGKNHADNYSLKSLAGTLIFIIIIFFTRTHIALSLDSLFQVLV